MDALTQLKHFVRYKTHGGYRWAAVMSDGALLCEPCTIENYRQVYAETLRASKGRHVFNSGWQCVGLAHSGESSDTEFCTHCNKLLWEAPT